MGARKLGRRELSDMLRWAANLIQMDDSAEASIQYSWGASAGEYLVDGVIRYGNNMGQGSVRLLGDPDSDLKVGIGANENHEGR